MKNINVLHPVHKDITERLKYLNNELAEQVGEILRTNKAERHIRGGIATKEKYEKLRICHD